MKKITLLILTFLLLGQVIAQSDHNGNPVFNSVSTGETPFDDCLLISNYYTLKNNIENKQSSVFVAENPTIQQIEKAATSLSSEFFIITKKSKIVVMVMLLHEPKRAFMTVVMSDDKQALFPCNLKGDITENRAQEIIKENYDPNASIKNGKLHFNGKELVIISNEDIEAAVLALIKSEKLDENEPSNIIIPSTEELKRYILAESEEGGNLDHFTQIKGKEYDGVQIKEGVFTTLGSIALYKWGRDCYDLGVNTIEDVYELFATFKKRKLNQGEEEYIKMGFYKELEK